MCANLEIRGRHGADDVAQLAASRSVSAVLIRRRQALATVRLVRVTEGLAPATAPALEATLRGRGRAGLRARRAHALEGPLKRRLPLFRLPIFFFTHSTAGAPPRSRVGAGVPARSAVAGAPEHFPCMLARGFKGRVRFACRVGLHP
jgi:hypothetical protein